MKPKTEWKNRWRRHIAGMALFGAVSEARDSPLQRCEKIMKIPEEVEALLDKMYQDLDDSPMKIPEPPKGPHK